MSISLADAARLPAKDWRWIADRLVASIRYHVREKKYFRGRRYSKDYADLKADRAAIPDGGVGQASTSRVPDLTLTGKMLDSLDVRHVDEYGFVAGWVGAEAVKVEANADMGRAITTPEEPLIPPVDADLQRDVDQMYSKRVAAVSTTTTITIRL